ncbi:MAG TPA: hypothetical protein ENI87_00270 [bacterium]|nr:hypothetical protein [bacterium]
MRLDRLFPVTDGDLLAMAARIRARLPAARPGSRVTLAFGRDRPAFAAALLAAWSRGHAANVVENAQRERIQPVLAHPDSVFLLHDTDAGRELQVPRLLAQQPLGEPLVLDRELTPAAVLHVHVQGDDGRQQWCAWTPDELALALDEIAPLVAGRAPDEQPTTPGFLCSLFADTLLPLRRHHGIAGHSPVGARGLRIRGGPEPHPEIARSTAALRALPGITDAAIVAAADGSEQTLLAGPGAAEVASGRPDAHAVATIPRDPNGEPRRAEVLLLAGLGRAGQPICRELSFRELARSDAAATLRTTLPTNYLIYEGHFADYPVMAGGAQLHELVLPCLRLVLGELPDLQALDNVKFLARFLPGEALDIELELADDRRKVAFEIRRDGTRCTTGRLTFAAELPPLAPR